MKSLPEARVARLAECHKEQKAGYDQHTSPHETKGSEKANAAPTALKYGQDELTAKGDYPSLLIIARASRILEVTHAKNTRVPRQGLWDLL
jgi:hypothetical protein